MRRMRRPGWLAAVACLLLAGCLDIERTTVTDYKSPPPPPRDELADDKPADRPALPLDPSLVDRRPLDGWRLNSSAAVLRLDVPAVKPDVDKSLGVLHPSYAAACKAARRDRPDEVLLPSINLLDGKAKQFDDGLVAAIDLACCRGSPGRLRGNADVVKSMYAALPATSAARPFLASGLLLAGIEVPGCDPGETKRWLLDFERDPARSRPVGFYTWNDDLKKCFRFHRFFQTELTPDAQAIVRDLGAVLRGNRELRADYERLVAFSHKLSTAGRCRDLLHAVEGQPVAVFPSSASKEDLLFAGLAVLGLPPDADLMGELIRAIRSGKLDLRPRPEGGWYDYQLHALETLLLPGRGEEHAKLLLTRRYKKRMLEAFKALITKRRETHIRRIPMTMGATAPRPLPMPKKIRPRLRVEPCPSYYVRTARSYAFLFNFLEGCIGAEGLKALHGLRQDRAQAADLYAELAGQRDLFYGLYLVSCEDLGLRPRWLKEEAIDQERCYQLACAWLPRALDDGDLARDTRVVVPILHDPRRNVTRLWATLGVRLARLEATYLHPPHLKPAEGGDWQPVEKSLLAESTYLICVDEFAEVETSGLRPLTREEFRALCDRHGNKAAIVAALRRR